MSTERMEPERLEEMAMGHVLGALDDEERTRFETLLVEGDPEALRLVEQFSETADALLLAAPPAAPPAGLKGRILAAAGVSAAGGLAAEGSATRPSGVTGGTDATGMTGAVGSTSGRLPVSEAPAERAPRRSDYMKLTPRGLAERNWVLTGLALAAAAGLAIVAWQALQLSHKLEGANEQMSEAQLRISTLESELNSVKLNAARQAELVRLLEDPHSGLVTLASLAPAQGASARVLWDPQARRGYLWVRNLAPDGGDKDYQLWAIAGKKPVSAGVFSVTADGSALIPLDSLTTAEERIGAFAITLEPAGGLPAPSGQILLVGNVTG